MASVTDLQTMYGQTVVARYYEERLVDEYLVDKQPAFGILAGPIPGELRLAIGHEASGAGACMYFRDDDTVTAPHQPHRIVITKGADLKRMTAEILGQKTGLCRGKGGRMHLFNPDINFACADIIAQGCPLTVGAMMTAKERSTDSAAVTFLDEGAVDQDGFLESLNLVAARDLPVVFAVEDNNWIISTPRDHVIDVRDGVQRAAGFDLPDARIDSDNVTVVYEAVGEVVIRIRDDNRSTLIEVQVHRRMGHFMGNAEAYRPEVDIGRVKQRDSIERPAVDLRSHSVTDDDVDEMRERARGRVEAAVSWAKEQPEPGLVEAYENMFTNPPAQATTDGGSVADVPGNAGETGGNN